MLTVGSCGIASAIINAYYFALQQTKTSNLHERLIERRMFYASLMKKFFLG